MKKKFIAALLAVIMLFAVLIPSGLLGNIKADGNNGFISPENVTEPVPPTTYFQVWRNENFTNTFGDAANWDNIHWELYNSDMQKYLVVGEGEQLIINYSMVAPMLFEYESNMQALFCITGIRKAGGTQREVALSFAVKVSPEKYDIQPLEPPKPDVYHVIEPQAGYETYPDQTPIPYTPHPTPEPEPPADSGAEGQLPGGEQPAASEPRVFPGQSENNGDSPLSALNPAQQFALCGVLDAQAEGTPAPVRLEVEYKYKDENGNEAGVIAPGWYVENPTEDSYKVTFHEIAGYKATVNGEEQTSYTFTPENGEYTSKTVTVIYVPQEVSYNVTLCKENLDGTYEETTLTGEHKALTGSQIDMDALCNADENQITGFGKPYYHEKPRVKGDGSTVAAIYLDRKYILIDFDLGEGGYGVEPIYKKYGEAISVGTPIRPGYNFTGWKLADEDGNATGELISSESMPTAMPDHNTKYIAQWTPAGDTKYSIVYWYENADDNGYSVAGTGSGTGTIGTEVTRESHKGDSFTGRDDTHFTYNPDKGEDVKIKGDGTTVLNVYYTRNVYTLTFTDGDNEAWIATDTKAQVWADGGTEDDHRPKWDEDYTWTYSTWNDTKTVNVQALQTYLNEEHPAPKEGEVVEYTYYTNYRYRLKSKTMHFIFHNGEWYVAEETNAIYTITAKYNAYIGDKWAFTGSNGKTYPQKPPDKTTSWTPINSSTYTQRLTHMERMPDENITFEHTTSNNTARQFYYYVEALDGTTGERTFDGKSFNLYLDLPNDFNIIFYNEDFFLLEGFDRYKVATADGTEVTISTSGTDWESTWDSTLYFYYTRNNYKLKFMNGGVELTGLTQDVPYQKNLESYKPTNEPACPAGLEPGAYIFDGWSVSNVIADSTKMTDEMWENDTMPAADRILYARWIPVTHKVTFRDNEEDPLPDEKITVPHGSLIPEDKIPEDPTQTGFDFVGWFYKDTDEQGVEHEHAFKPDQMPVRCDMNLYAKWKATTQYKYTVNYYLEGTTTPVAEPTVGIGEPNDSFTVNAKKGYSENHPSELFWEYWQFYNPIAPESQTFTLDEDNKVITFYYKEATATITYVPVTEGQTTGTIGGTVSPDKDENIGKVTGKGLQGSTPTPATNYKFVGWYTDEECTNPVPKGWVDEETHKLTPQRTFDAGVPTTGTSTLWVFENKTYYAKFELDIADLTITKTVTGNKVYDENDIFVFKITGGPDNVTMELTIKASELDENGTKSVVIHDLKVGTYTVTEDTGWSWRYNCTSPEGAAQTVTLAANETNEVTFTNELTKENWLSASCDAVNEYGKENGASSGSEGSSNEPEGGGN